MDKHTGNHKIITSVEDRASFFTFYFNYNDASIRSLLSNHLIIDVHNIIFDYVVNPFHVRTYTSTNANDLKYKNITIVLRTYNNDGKTNDQKFKFSFGGMFKQQLEYNSTYPNQMIDILTKDINTMSIEINYKYIFEEYVKYIGNINNQKVDKYLSKLDVPKCDCGDSGWECVERTCKYDIENNRFSILIRGCRDIVDKCRGYVIVKDHEMLKCIIEVIKCLHDNNVFDDVIGL